MVNKELFTWVSDNVIKLTGMSEATIIEFIITSCASSRSANDFVKNTLYRDAQFPRERAQEVDEFGNQLFSKMHSTFKKVEKVEKIEKVEKVEKIEKVEKVEKFKMLLEEESIPASKTKKKKKVEKEEKSLVVMKGKRLRKTDRTEKSNAWDILDAAEDFDSDHENEEGKVNEDYDSERERDLKERDEFAKRLREKDLEKLLAKSEKKIDEKTRQRQLLANDREARKNLMPSLRDRSRFEYLKKREEEKLALLEQEIKDEEELFRNESLTRKEVEALEKKKTLLKLAKERLSIDTSYDGYMMPEDYITEKGKLDKKKQDALLYSRYQDRLPAKEKIETDQDEWEKNQARYSHGIGKINQPHDETEFDYVFDEEQRVDFVLHNTGGEAVIEEGPKMSEAERKGIFDEA
jgi:pre-mRNA-splicing factor ATP-dependent RNA helicase DHX16